MITVERSPHSDEAHQENKRRRILHIHEEIKICCDAPSQPKPKEEQRLGRKSSKSVKVRIKIILSVRPLEINTPVY